MILQRILEYHDMSKKHKCIIIEHKTCFVIVVIRLTHSFSRRVIQTTSLTPGLLAFSLEQRCRFQVATRTAGFPSREAAGGSTQGRTEQTSGGPPSGASSSSLPPPKDVGLGCVSPPFVFVEGVLERSTNTWKRMRSSRDELMLDTLTRSSMLRNGPCAERNSTMLLASFSVMPRTLMSCGGVAVFMLTPMHGRCSCSLRRDEGEWLDELFLLDTQISSLTASSFVAPTPLTSARSSTFLNPPMHSRYSTMLWATPRLTPGRVMSSSSVAVLMFSRSWFTSIWLKLHAALNLRLPWQKSVGSLGMDRWHPRFPPMCPGESVCEPKSKAAAHCAWKIPVAHRLVLIFNPILIPLVKHDTWSLIPVSTCVSSVSEQRHINAFPRRLDWSELLRGFSVEGGYVNLSSEPTLGNDSIESIHWAFLKARVYL